MVAFLFLVGLLDLLFGLLLSLSLLLVSLALLALPAPVGLELIVEGDLFEVVVGQQQGEVVLAVAPNT